MAEVVVSAEPAGPLANRCSCDAPVAVKPKLTLGVTLRVTVEPAEEPTLLKLKVRGKVRPAKALPEKSSPVMEREAAEARNKGSRVAVEVNVTAVVEVVVTEMLAPNKRATPCAKTPVGSEKTRVLLVPEVTVVVAVAENCAWATARRAKRKTTALIKLA